MTKKMLEILGNRQMVGAWMKKNMMRVAMVAMMTIGAMGVAEAGTGVLPENEPEHFINDNLGPGVPGNAHYAHNSQYLYLTDTTGNVLGKIEIGSSVVKDMYIGREDTRTVAVPDDKDNRHYIDSKHYEIKLDDATSDPSLILQKGFDDEFDAGKQTNVATINFTTTVDNTSSDLFTVSSNNGTINYNLNTNWVKNAYIGGAAAEVVNGTGENTDKKVINVLHDGTLMVDESNKLSVNIDNDTIYYDNESGTLKAKVGGGAGTLYKMTVEDASTGEGEAKVSKAKVVLNTKTFNEEGEEVLTPQDTATFVGDENITVSAEADGIVKVAMNDDINVNNITVNKNVKLGETVINHNQQGGINITNTTTKTSTTINGDTITTNKINATTIDLGNNKVINKEFVVKVEELDNRAVKYDVKADGSVDYTKITLAGEGGTTITNVKAGAVNATSTDAVNGSQLHETNVNIQNVKNEIDAHKEEWAKDTNTTYSFNPVFDKDYPEVVNAIDFISSEDGRTATIAAGENVSFDYDKAHNTFFINASGGGIDPQHGEFGYEEGAGIKFNTEKLGGSIAIEANVDNKTIVIDKDSNEIKLADDVQKKIENNTININNIRKDVNRLDGKIDKVGAHAAALAGIHYQDMRPGESQIGVGVGGYKGKRATALGIAYQANNRVMVQASASAGSGEYMANLGVSYKFGQHSVRNDVVEKQDPATMTLAQAETAAMVQSLQYKNNAQAQTINELNDRVAKLEALVAQMANK